MPAPRATVPGLRTRALALLTALLLGGGVLTACSSGSGDAAESSESSSSTESAGSGASPSATTNEAAASEQPDDPEDAAGTAEEASPPALPRPANTVKGRVAFVDAVVARWGYALQTNDAAALGDLSPAGSPCLGCKELAKELGERRKEGWSVAFPGASVRRTSVEPDGPRTFRAEARISIPASTSYFDDGTYRNENRAVKDAAFEVGMRWTGSRFVLLSWRLEV